MALSVSQIQAAQEKEAARIEKLIDEWLLQNAKPKNQSSHYEETIRIESVVGEAIVQILKGKYIKPGSGWKDISSRGGYGRLHTEITLHYEF